jgi:hypothetical protein
MDPMSAITAGLGALTSIFGAVGGIADAVKSGAGLVGQIFDSLGSLFSGSQSSTAQQVGQESTQGWPQDQSGYALAQISINI